MKERVIRDWEGTRGHVYSSSWSCIVCLECPHFSMPTKTKPRLFLTRKIRFQPPVEIRSANDTTLNFQACSKGACKLHLIDRWHIIPRKSLNWLTGSWEKIGRTIFSEKCHFCWLYCLNLVTWFISPPLMACVHFARGNNYPGEARHLVPIRVLFQVPG